uniref:Uncharacterized protein n=1 Tax=Anguilla anguilla TaxID=7936 RepID=A0A0E9QPD9_ANGAN
MDCIFIILTMVMMMAVSHHNDLLSTVRRNKHCKNCDNKKP